MSRQPSAELCPLAGRPGFRRRRTEDDHGGEQDTESASILRIGVGLTPLTEQLADYFGVVGGVLINNVRSDSPAFKAGLKAGDVIVGSRMNPL
jgi:C-terminal processing protease CtpA/Prc